ncbi:hypothetical protein AB5I41_21925 [Sphingomonas sp. MMS24-JH45]
MTEQGIRFYAGMAPPRSAASRAVRPRYKSTRGADAATGRWPARGGGGDGAVARIRATGLPAARRSTTPAARRTTASSASGIPADTMPQMVWSTRCPTASTIITMRAGRIHRRARGHRPRRGVERDSTTLRPGSQRAWGALAAQPEIGDPDDRIPAAAFLDGTIPLVLGAARCLVRDAQGRHHVLVGTLQLDIHEQKLAFEEREIISQELSHRIKNIFSVIAGFIQFAARAHPAGRARSPRPASAHHGAGPAHDFCSPTQPQLPSPLAAGQPPRPVLRLSPPSSAPATRIPRRGRGHHHRRSRRHPAGAAVPRAGDQREQIWRAVWSMPAASRPHVAREGADVRVEWRETGGRRGRARGQRIGRNWSTSAVRSWAASWNATGTPRALAVVTAPAAAFSGPRQPDGHLLGHRHVARRRLRPRRGSPIC